MRTNDPIAITGIGCRFPGNADSPQAFWQILCKGVDAITEVPADRWSIRTFYNPEPGLPGKTYSKWGGFIRDIDKFDAGFFGISPREAALMDPQQRLLLEASYEALEDGGQLLENIAGSNTGVFVGVSTTDYQYMQTTYDDQHAVELHSTTGTVLSIVANRVSYCFDLKGPSVALDTACSSSLVAVHLACQSIWSRESAMALAGGVNAIFLPQAYIDYCKLSMLSPHGRCRAFDASGDGFVRGEGVGVVLLKPLSRALDDGDTIYAVIRGTAANQDGRTNGITVPNGKSQAAMIRGVCREAGIAPELVQYVETHGTGTFVGDPIEAEALGSVFSPDRPAGRPLVIGSVKTNIGHLEAGAGIAGLIKTALCIKHRQIPPSLNFHTPNPLIDFGRLKLEVRTLPGSWPDDSAPLLAGVNSFGFGGSNAHALLSDVPAAAPAHSGGASAEGQAARLIPLSAQSSESLKALARRHADFIQQMKNDEAISLDDLGGTLALRRSHFSHRMTVVARTREELVEHLEAHLAGEARPGMRTGVASQRPEGKLAFVFSGQGQQWWGMGRQLLTQEPVFRQVLEECDALLSMHASWSLLRELLAGEAESRLQETSIAQPVIFALQAGLAALWKSWGIEPEAVIGHSVGEVGAAYVAGILSLEDAVRVIYHRGRTTDLVSSKGRMLGAAISPEEAGALLRGYEDRVSIAAANSPTSVTLSGDPAALEELAKILDARQVFQSFLKVNYAFHSPQMDPVREELLGVLEGLTLKPSSRTFYSTVLGAVVEGRELDAEYWWRNVRCTVQFGPGIQALIDSGHRFFVELAAHPVLSAYVNECLTATETPGVVVTSLRRNEEDRPVMLNALGGLYTAGYPVDWRRQYPRRPAPVALPRYPWNHESHWHECDTMRAWRLGTSPHPLLGERLKSAQPIWKVELSCTAFPYLNDHLVQGHRVFPAAGYLEMAMAAARETGAGGTTVLEEVDFLKPLFIPESGEAPEVQTSLQPEDGTWAIHARESVSQPWTLHAKGRFRVEPQDGGREPVKVEELKGGLGEVVPGGLLYQVYDDRGIRFGPSFRGIGTLLRRDGAALASVQLPSQCLGESPEYIVHPAALDACLQALPATYPGGAAQRGLDVLLPVHVAQVKCHGKVSGALWSHARLLRHGPRSMEGDITVLDQEGSVLIEIRGLRGQSVDTMQGDSSESVDGWLYDVIWPLRPRARSAATGRQNAYMPPMAALEQRLAGERQENAALRAWRHRQLEGVPAFNLLCSSYIVQAFRRLGWSPEAGEKVRPEQLAEKLGILPQYQRLLRRYLDYLATDGVLKKHDGTWEVLITPEAAGPERPWRTMLQTYPALYAELMLTAACGNRLAEVMQGTTDPLDLIFPEGSQAVSEHLFQDSPSFKGENWIAGRAVAAALAHLPEGRKARLLEIGGGTAGLTSYVLSELPADLVEYVFTDISPLFLRKAEQKLRDAGFITYQTLDIEKDPEVQGFTPHSFDVVLASDALHATKDLGAVLENVCRLLASGGLFVLLETDNPARWTDLVFGLTKGWWRFEDDIRSDYPLLSKPEWDRLLRAKGFQDPMVVSEDYGPGEASQAVFIARGPVLASRAEAQRAAPGARTPRQWLIFADKAGTGAAVAGHLRQHGDATVLVSYGETYALLNDGTIQIDPVDGAGYRRLLHDAKRFLPSLDGVLHCWSLDAAAPEETTTDSLEAAAVLGCHSVTRLIQAWSAAETPARFDLWLVTGGAQPAGNEQVQIAQAPLIGLARVIANEHPDLRCRAIDLSRRPGQVEIQSLCEELASDEHDDEIALRGEARYSAALARSAVLRTSTRGKKAANPATEPLRVETSGPGVLDNLTLRESVRRAPGPGEVEIRVVAASLNFRDVLKALGAYPADSEDRVILGDECAGVIVAAGDGVTEFAPGDEVMAVARGCLGSYVTAPAAGVVKKPACIDFEEAATMPVAFLTASYALHTLGRIAQGERVLIQAGAGGVGLAAIQIAQSAGAEVFATAGSQEKRDLLRSLGVKHVMNSRTLSFADEIMEVTGGRGVDIVLNSLAGDAIARGLSCLAPSGRFVELGIRDIFQNTRLGLRAFKNGTSFMAVGPGTFREKPELIRSGLEAIVRRVEAGRLHPLPYRLFPLGEVRNAFRFMAQARHVGKIVLSFRDGRVLVEPRAKDETRFREDATYLVTGGLGGFGLATAEWLVRNGARHLALAGRSGAVSGEAAASIAAMEKKGARVVIHRTDVTRAEEVERLIGDIHRSMPPLRGVIHSAMVLDDGALLQLTQERFRKVMQPKVSGAWNLHQATKQLPLDFFLLYSSVSTLAGNPGQANYVAANMFLEALAHYRRRLGLPALAVSWGHVSDVGYVARNAQVGAHLDGVGLRGFGSAPALQALGRVLGTDRAHVGIMKVDWQCWFQYAPAHQASRFSLLMDPELSGAESAQVTGRIRDSVLAAPPEQRAALLQAFLTEQIARVVGLSPSKVDQERPLNEMGLDSLMMMELKNRIEKNAGVSLATVDLMRGPTIVRLTQKLLSHVAGQEAGAESQPAAKAAPAAGQPKETAAELLQQIETLPESRVEELLKSMDHEKELRSFLEEQSGEPRA